MKMSLVIHTAVVLLALVNVAAAEDKGTGISPHSVATSSSTDSPSTPIVAMTEASQPMLLPATMLSDMTDTSSAMPANPDPMPLPVQAAPIVEPSESRPSSVQWKSLMKGSLLYLGVMHSFRVATEGSTRLAMSNSVGGYFSALGAMHGWSDGDGYYENYLGHPMEGGVSGYMWIHNDPRYRVVQFGANRDYWISRLRGYAFAWAFSEQFEIGPISEASIGQIQRYCCGYGFVDHVVTPNGGLVWMLAGDALDRYVTVPIENRTHNRTLRILARAGLNPTQSFANLMMLQYPWHRENRDSVTAYDGTMYLRDSRSLSDAISPGTNGGFNGVPRFELAASVPGFYEIGGLNCLGGGGIGAFRATDIRQWTMEVSGCTLGNSLPANWSGDSLTFTAGPQWIVHTAGRWSPHAHFRVGVQKITEEHLNPTLEKKVLSDVPPGKDKNDYRYLYVQHWETTGFTIAFGGGLDIALNRALALRVADFDYSRSWLGDLNGRTFDHGLRLSTGIVLRIGTW